MSTAAVAGLYDAALALLAAAGVSKARRPSDTSTALAGIGLPATPRRVRVAAVAEVAVAAVAVAVGGVAPAVLVALSYAGFTAFVAVALVRRLPLATCGCFGRPDSPPSWAHVAVDAAATAAASLWAAGGGGAAVGTLRHQPWAGVPLALGALVVAGLAATVLSDPLARARHAAVAVLRRDDFEAASGLRPTS